MDTTGSVGPRAVALAAPRSLADVASRAAQEIASTALLIEASTARAKIELQSPTNAVSKGADLVEITPRSREESIAAMHLVRRMGHRDLAIADHELAVTLQLVEQGVFAALRPLAELGDAREQLILAVRTCERAFGDDAV